jgi:Acyl CoA:acetate/3-ketoacid CoA transferase, alpha subunit
VEEPIDADFALVHAHRADYVGNLSYTLTAQNFNPVMTMAARTVLAEADEIVPLGVIAPDDVRTPGTLIDYVLERQHS